MFVSLPDHECLMKMKSASRLDSENIFFISYVTYVSMNNKSRKEIRSEEIIVGTRFSLLQIIKQECFDRSKLWYQIFFNRRFDNRSFY